MSSRRTKKRSMRQRFLYEVYGVLAVSFSVFLFISIYLNPGGIAENFVNMALMGVCGFGAYIIPFLMLFVGIALIIKQDKLAIKLKFYALCFLFLFLLILISITKSVGMGSRPSYIEKIVLAYALGLKGSGGGAFGEMMAYPVIWLLGEVGAYLFSITFIIINLLLFTNASIYSICSAIKSSMAAMFSNLKNRRRSSGGAAQKKSDNEPSANCDDERKNYIDDINRKIKILDFFKDSDMGPGDGIVVSDGGPAAPDALKTPPNCESDAAKSGDHRIQEEIDNNSKNKIEQYIFPSAELLNSPPAVKGGNDKKELIGNAKILEETLESFGVMAKVVQVSRGPVITSYELQPSPGVKVSKIVNLADDIALNLAAPSVRIEAPIPGKAAVGIEVPNKEMSSVYLREVIESKEFKETDSPLTFALGKNVAGNCVVGDLSTMPHLLIAGATGSGKSVCINSLITSIMYKASPESAKLLLIDPKVVELNTYNGIPHLLIPVVTDARKAAGALTWAVQEMTKRYKLFADNSVRNIEGYNELMRSQNPEAVLPKIVIIIDELADLMMVAANDVEDCICRLAQMARAAGMHLVVATQRPSVDVITGVIKANIPSRISFAVSSQIDSRTILDMAGAEKLLGKGDMLYFPVGASKPVRVQGAFISDKEVERVVGFVKKQSASEYEEEIMDEIENGSGDDGDDKDELLPEAIRIAVDSGQISISMLQRRLRIGYNRAARLIDGLERRGIIGGYEGSKPRQVLISKEEYEQMR